MTVSSTTTKVTYSGDGSTLVFPYTFKIFAASDLVVTQVDSSDVETVLVLNSQYTVSGVGDAGGGNVTLTITAPSATDTLVIQRVLSITQGTDYVENDPFPANSHENALDRLTFICQQLQEQLNRVLIQPITISTQITFPSPEASKVIAWNSGATALENITVGSGSTLPNITGGDALKLVRVNSGETGYELVTSTVTGWADDGTTVRLDTATDEVGIGTASPGGKLEVENASGEAQTALVVDQDAVAQKAIDVEAANTTGDVIQITANALTTGDGLRITSTSADTNSRNLIEVVNDDALATGTVGVRVQQDSTGPNIILNAAGNGPHINLIGDPTVASPADGDFWFTGSALNFRNGAATVDLLSAGGVETAVGKFSYSANTTGNLAITNVGLQPTEYLIWFWSSGAVSNAYGQGFVDSTGTESVVWYSEVNDNIDNTGGNQLYIDQAPATTRCFLTHVSFDADGFTVDRSVSGTPAGTVFVCYVAIAT